MLLLRFVRDKSESLCDVVELLMTNPLYVRIKQRMVVLILRKQISAMARAV